MKDTSTWLITDDVTLHLAKVEFVMFLQSKVTFPRFHILLSGSKSLSANAGSEEVIKLCVLEGEVPI